MFAARLQKKGSAVAQIVFEIGSGVRARMRNNAIRRGVLPCLHETPIASLCGHRYQSGGWHGKW